MVLIKSIFLFFTIISINSKETKSPIETEDTLKLDQTNYDNDAETNIILINKINDLLKAYIDSRQWTQKKQIDNYTFTRMFIYVTSKSLFKKSTREQLNILAEKIIEIHNKPIIIEEIKSFFDIEELRNVYKNLFGNKNFDL